jgi:hypothetical protein
MFDLCPPALIYIAFSLTQVVIDTFKGLYNTAIIKIFVSIIITLLLNTLCKTGMGIISWIIVFVPFIFMTVIVGILLYTFGLDPSTGKLNIKCSDNDSKNKGGNLIFIKTNKKSNNDKSNNDKSNNDKYMDVSYSEQPLENNNEVYIWNSSDPQYS